MARDKLTYASGNSASTTLASSVTNTDTSFPLTSDTNFAAKSGEGMVVVDEATANEEYGYATGKTGSALNIPLANRGLEGTSAVGHASTATVKGIITSSMWNDVIDSVCNVLVKATGALDTTKVVDLTTAQTLTTKRITKRVTTEASSATPTPNADTSDMYTITALGAGATFGVPSGTPTSGQPLVIRIKDDGTARALDFNAIYRFSSDLAKPTTTVISKTMYLGFIYNAADTKWDCVAKLDNF
jgi:hypothetical protein